MSLPLVSHINGDGDILRAWCRHYVALGVTSFHIVAHGSEEENRVLLGLRREFPIEIRDAWAGPYLDVEKKARLDAVLATFPSRWVLVVDSDEFVELPTPDLAGTIRALEVTGADVLPAPMLQHLRPDGSIASPPLVEDPFGEFPLCAEHLYRDMGVKADIRKHPLFYCRPHTRLSDPGNHNFPAGCRRAPRVLRGVTHHFKWRESVMERLTQRAYGEHPWRHEALGYLSHLERTAGRLPLDGAFPYSRAEMFRRGLLRRPTRLEALLLRLRPAGWRPLSAGLQATLARTYSALRARKML